MIELPLVLMGGLLGSSHCIGMCGGLALLIGSGARTHSANVLRQLAYSTGRIFTYAAGGAVAGYVGMRISRELPMIVHAQAALAILAGVLLVTQGAISAGLLSWVRYRGPWAGCGLSGMLGQFLRSPGAGPAFIAGVLTGLLPCGLVYGFIALAASTGSLWKGSLLMAVFGVGTVPMMTLAGMGGSFLGVAARSQAVRIAAVCVMLTGGISLVRGASNLTWTTSGDSSAPACPLCSMDTVHYDAGPSIISAATATETPTKLSSTINSPTP